VVAAVVAAGAGVALLGSVGAVAPGVLMFLPALLLAAALLAGRYPGEQLLARCVRARPRSRSANAGVPVPERQISVFPRGGRLIAAALAGRAPPVLAAG
jgi:hypothetical protein